MNLTEAQRDALTEIINIGTNKAGRQLSVLLDDTIDMVVPKVELVDYAELAKLLGIAQGEEVVCIRQQVEGAITGQILLLFHSEESRQLVHTLIEPLQPFSSGTEIDIRHFEYEAMTEIGNIIISSCATAMSDFLGRAVRLNIPTYNEGPLDNVLSQVVEQHALLIRTSLHAVRRDVNGTLIITLSIADLNTLVGRLDKIIASLVTP
jgi:chemotaxis protein CheC